MYISQLQWCSCQSCFVFGCIKFLDVGVGSLVVGVGRGKAAFACFLLRSWSHFVSLLAFAGIYTPPRQS